MSGLLKLSRETLASLPAPGCNNLAPTWGRHTCTKAMFALAPQILGLKGAFHNSSPTAATSIHRRISNHAGLFKRCFASSQ